jgi:hypothetical protein
MLFCLCMKLLFHIGLNKVASTFIQDVFSVNASLLIKNGLCYAGNRTVSEGRGGSWSGNASEFALALRDLDRKKARNIFLCHLKEAEAVDCKTLLLSTEFMYHQIIKKEQQNLFISLCDEFGVHDVDFVAFFRSPLGHAVSAYNHRVGCYDMPSFSDWVSCKTVNKKNFRSGIDGYEFWSELPLFVKNVLRNDRFGVNVIVLSGNLLEKVSALVGCNLVPPGKEQSNVSVNCVEGVLLRFLRQKSRYYAHYYRAFSKELSDDLKAADEYIKSHYYGLVGDEIMCVSGEIKEIEKIVFPEKLVDTISSKETRLFDENGNPFYVLSSFQIETLIKAISRSHSFDVRIRQMVSIIRSLVIKK